MELITLRSATAMQHRKLENDLNLVCPSVASDHYVALLKRFYGFHLPWELKVAAGLEKELPDFFKPRRKLRNLEASFRYFGSGTEDLSIIVRCNNLPPLNSFGPILRSVCVSERSSLGGRMLTRHFSEQLGIGPDAGCRYFSGYGDRTVQMWSAFEKLMAQRPPTENDEMLTAALSTFRLGQWVGM